MSRSNANATPALTTPMTTARPEIGISPGWVTKSPRWCSRRCARDAPRPDRPGTLARGVLVSPGRLDRVTMLPFLVRGGVARGRGDGVEGDERLEQDRGGRSQLVTMVE